jgi:Uma2 family endonuclease
MVMPTADTPIGSYEGALALLEAQVDRSVRLEFTDGALLVTPAPGGYHQRFILALFRLLDPYVAAESLGEVRLGPSPVALLPRTIFQPDLYVVPAVDGRRPRADLPVTSASLVVEVLSPGSVQHDRVTKRRAYQRAQVAEYWVVDLDGRLVERWRPGDLRPEVIDGDVTWQPPGASAPLTIDLLCLFRGVRDDNPGR